QGKVLDQIAHFQQNLAVGRFHANLTSATSPLTDTWWQATRCRAEPFSTSSGSSLTQSSSARGQRGWKRQPEGGESKLGGVPGIETIGARSARMSGKACVSPWVYGWRGRTSTSSTGPCSTILPAYITATSSQVCATTDKSWLTRISDSPRRCL